MSLFREETKSRSARYACADAVLIVDDAIRLILEIEEAGTKGFLPTRIAGKLTTSALCRYFIAGGKATLCPSANTRRLCKSSTALDASPEAAATSASWTRTRFPLHLLKSSRICRNAVLRIADFPGKKQER